MTPGVSVYCARHSLPNCAECRPGNNHSTPSDLETDRLRAEVADLKATLPREPFDVRCADALADAVDVLVRRHVIDARSPAADALLDYRNPPQTPRLDRLVAAEAEVATLRAALAEATQEAELKRIGAFVRECSSAIPSLMDGARLRERCAGLVETIAIYSPGTTVADEAAIRQQFAAAIRGSK